MGPTPVYVEWVDAAHFFGWADVVDVENTPNLCHTLGWLIGENEDSVMIAQTWDEPWRQIAAQYLVIPRQNIRSIRPVSISKRRRKNG
jgi:hypothetical protein